MAKYLLMLLSDENAQYGEPPQALFEGIGELAVKWGAEGVLTDTGGLAVTAAGAQVRSEDDGVHVLSGPFHTGGEAVTGYAMVEVESQDVAVARAKEFIDCHRTHWPAWRGASEVRAVFGP